MKTTREHRDEVSPETRDWRGMVRRVAIKLTSGSIWQVMGHRLLSGDKETRDAEAFSNVGFFSRPPAGANAEAVEVHPGGFASGPLIIATRDEDTRKKVAVIDQDETIIYNSAVIAVCKKTGQMWICAPGAAPVGVALASELNSLRAFVVQQFAGAGHLHAVSGGTTTATTPVIAPVILPVTNYPGSQVLKTQ